MGTHADDLIDDALEYEAFYGPDEFSTTCFGCQEEILMVPEARKWKPYNPDYTRHVCDTSWLDEAIKEA